MKTREVTIPFSGFYESYPMDLLNDAVEQLDPHDEHHADIDYEGFAKMHIERYKQSLKDEHGFELSIKFKALESPRFYNYGTDRIFAEIPVVQLFNMYQEFKESTNSQKVIDSRFKSRVGFFSHYEDFCEDWKEKPLGTWDHNELGILFEGLGAEDLDLYEDINCNGELDELITLTLID